jgi:hypothetical protein
VALVARFQLGQHVRPVTTDFDPDEDVVEHQPEADPRTPVSHHVALKFVA